MSSPIKQEIQLSALLSGQGNVNSNTVLPFGTLTFINELNQSFEKHANKDNFNNLSCLD